MTDDVTDRDRLDADNRAVALRMAVDHVDRVGGDVIRYAEDFYVFLCGTPQIKSANAGVPLNEEVQS